MNDYVMTRWCEDACVYIKYKPDRKTVGDELMSHIIDKHDALVAAGMAPQEAAKTAVAAMGDANEVGRGLAKAHNPVLGYLLTASKVLLCLALVCAFLAIFGARGRFGIFPPDAEAAAAREERMYTGEYFEWVNEDDEVIGSSTRTLYLEPGCTAKSDGYTFTVTRVAEWRGEYTYHETGEKNEDYMLYLTIKAWHPLPWASYPEAVRWFSAVDSFGNLYINMWSARYINEKHLIGNPTSRTPFSYTYEMWLGNYEPGAEWVELRYDREGRDVVMCINLTEGLG